MTKSLTLDALLRGCADESFDDGIRIDTELEPVAGPGGSVKPAVYEGGKYQQDKRWASVADEQPTPVVVIDNVPSQANRIEEALRRNRASAGVPEFRLDLSSIPNLPVHLPRQISSLQFPHRNADGYLRDARLGDEDFIKTDLGRSIFGATAAASGPLMAWFPQALLFGFWQSHLGKKRQNTKHPRAWVSEIVGWNPATTDTRVMGLKGDPLNLSVDETVMTNANDQLGWQIGKGARGGKRTKLSEIGHGQVPFMKEGDATPAGISFGRISQRATVSFAHLRRVSLGSEAAPAADAAARALLVALGLYGHILAFGRGFALRSGAELRPQQTTMTWLGGEGDDPRSLGSVESVRDLLHEAREQAASAGVPLDGWVREPVVLTPKENLQRAIRTSWPELAD